MLAKSIKPAPHCRVVAFGTEDPCSRIAFANQGSQNIRNQHAAVPVSCHFVNRNAEGFPFVNQNCRALRNFIEPIVAGLVYLPQGGRRNGYLQAKCWEVLDRRPSAPAPSACPAQYADANNRFEIRSAGKRR